MTEVAILVSRQMVDRRILTNSKYPVVTAVAAVGHTGMVKHAGGKTAGDVAHGTVLCCRDMIRRFTQGLRAVVAGGAVIHDARMIEYRRQESTRHVAHTTIFRSRQVIGRFTQGGNTVVAGSAITHDTGVIEYTGCKTANAMANATILRSRNMGDGLATGRKAIMAGSAIIGNSIVTENRWEKRRRVMAEVAILGSRHMIHRKVLASGVYAIVTACAANSYTSMIEHAGCELSGVMTHPAILGGGNMRGVLAGGVCTVMAGRTVTSDAIVSENRRQKRTC
jgi:hypothetical protein